MDIVFNNQIDPEFWGVSALPGNTERFQAWIYGVLGATISGWGIFVTFISHFAFKAKEKWAWNCIFLGFGLWFIADSAMSIYYGIEFNIIINLAFFIPVLLPLLFTRKYFSK